MSEFLGSRISLISRSDIRYVGILHQINSDDSTVSLENVKSFGTEGRKGNPDDEVPPSEQVYEYIVFRGTDVKDLRIEEGPGAIKENKPPVVPNDPAIVGARARPGNMAPGPSNQQAAPGGPGFGFYPPHLAGWGRAAGHGPGPGPFGGLQYPPPPGWFGPGQGFPPPGPVPWNNYPFAPGPAGHPGAPSAPGPNNRQGQNAQAQDVRPSPIGAGSDRKLATPTQQTESTPEPKPLGPAPAQATAPQPPSQPAPQLTATVPLPPVESKPTADEINATATTLASNGSSKAAAPEAIKPIPTGPKGTRPTQIMPAVPLPTALTARPAPVRATTTTTPLADSTATSAAALHDATQAAKAAVAIAMAQVAESPASDQQANGKAMENLTKKVGEMRLNTVRGGTNARGSRGRGPRPAKVEVPDADFDFASANAKFNKQDVLKEAIAGGSPLRETANGGASTPEAVAESSSSSVSIPPAYNKSKSFFDNISSEAKERSLNGGQKPGGREWRGEEQRKNMETFGQGSVDGGFRSGYRGRGRGRGGGLGRGRGFGRGGRGGGFRDRETQPVVQ